MSAIDVSYQYHLSCDYSATETVLAASSPKELYAVSERNSVRFTVVDFFNRRGNYTLFRASPSFEDFCQSYNKDIDELKRLVKQFFTGNDLQKKLRSIEIFKSNLFDRSELDSVVDTSVSYYRNCLYGEARQEFHRVVRFVESSPLPAAEKKTLISDLVEGLGTCTGGVQFRISSAYRKLYYSYLGINGALKNLCTDIVRAEALKYIRENNSVDPFDISSRSIYESHIVNYLLKSVEAKFAVETAADESGNKYRNRLPESYYYAFSRHMRPLLVASNVMRIICERYFEILMGLLQAKGLVSSTNLVVNFTQINGELLDDINVLVLEPFNTFLLNGIGLDDLFNYDDSSNTIYVRFLHLHWIRFLQQQYRNHFKPIAHKVCHLVPSKPKQDQTEDNPLIVQQAWGNFFWIEDKGRQTGLDIYQIMFLANREINTTILTGFLNSLEINSLKEAKECLHLLTSSKQSKIVKLFRQHALAQFRLADFFNKLLSNEFDRLQQQLSKTTPTDDYTPIDCNKLMPLHYLTDPELNKIAAIQTNNIEVFVVVEQARRGVLILPEQAMHMCRLGKLELILRGDCQLAADGVNQVFTFLVKENDKDAIRLLLSFIQSKNALLDPQLKANCCPKELLHKVSDLNDFNFTTEILERLPTDVILRESKTNSPKGSILHYCMFSLNHNAFKALLNCEYLDLNQMTPKGTVLQTALSDKKYKPFLLQLLQQKRLSLFAPLRVEHTCNFKLATDKEMKDLLITELTLRLKRAKDENLPLSEPAKPTTVPVEFKPEPNALIPQANWERAWEKLESCGDLDIMHQLISISFGCNSIEELMSKIGHHPALTKHSAHVYLKNLAWCIHSSDWITTAQSSCQQTHDFMKTLPEIKKPEMSCWLEFGRDLKKASLQAAIIINYFNQLPTESDLSVELEWLCKHPRLIPVGSFDHDYPQWQHSQLLIAAIKTANVQIVTQRILCQVKNNASPEQPLPISESPIVPVSTFVPLLYAIHVKQPQIAIKIAELDPRQISHFCPYIKGNALHFAAHRDEQPEVIKAMLPHCKINELIPTGFTALELALYTGCKKNVKQLLTHPKIDLFYRSKSGSFIYQLVQGQVPDDDLNSAIVLTSGHHRSRETSVNVNAALAPYKTKWLRIIKTGSFLRQFNILLAKCNAHSLQTISDIFKAGFQNSNRELTQGMNRILQAHLAVRIPLKSTSEQNSTH